MPVVDRLLKREVKVSLCCTRIVDENDFPGFSKVWKIRLQAAVVIWLKKINVDMKPVIQFQKIAGLVSVEFVFSGALLVVDRNYFSGGKITDQLEH